MPTGAIMKSHAIFDEPFWRADGLTGQSAAPGSIAPVTIDACNHDQRAGVPAVIAEGPLARKLTTMDAVSRREAVLAELAKRFGAKTKSPLDYIEQDWTVEGYSRGSMISHSPPGVLTQLGHALRAPCGRIHWAGTESSAVMYGFVDGAIRSGERAASEVLAA